MRIKTAAILLIGLIFAFGCSVKKEQDVRMALHDIWALYAIDSSVFEPTEGIKHPYIEINTTEMRLSVNDGCNNIFGQIEKADHIAIKFGAIAGTRMACTNMNIPYAVNNALSAATQYKIYELKLYLYDASGRELICFKKVD